MFGILNILSVMEVIHFTYNYSAIKVLLELFFIIHMLLAIQLPHVRPRGVIVTVEESSCWCSCEVEGTIHLNIKTAKQVKLFWKDNSIGIHILLLCLHSICDHDSCSTLDESFSTSPFKVIIFHSNEVFVFCMETVLFKSVTVSAPFSPPSVLSRS